MLILLWVSESIRVYNCNGISKFKEKTLNDHFKGDGWTDPIYDSGNVSFADQDI